MRKTSGILLVIATLATLFPGCGGFGSGATVLSGSSVTPPVTSKTPARIALASGDGQQALVATPCANPLVVTVTDASGSPVAGVSVTFAVTAGGGSLAATVVATDALGEARAALTVGPAPGPNTVTATATGAGNAPLAGAPITFTATGTQTAPPPPPPPPALSYQNDAAPILANKCTTCHVAGGQAASAPLDTYAAVVQGMSKFGYTPAAYVHAGQPASSLVIVKVTGTLAGPIMPPTGSPALTATETKTLSDWIAQGAVFGPPAPARINKVSGDAQSILAGGSLANPLVVAVVDAQGRAVPGVAVTFTVTAGAGTLTPASINTDASGLARSSLSAVAQGANTITVSATGCSPVTFTATGTSATQKLLAKISGDGQSAVVGAALAQPFVVKAADGAGNAIANATITFAVTAGGGTLSATSVNTDAAGLAKTTLTTGATVGTNTVTASAAGFTPSLTFTAKATSATQKLLSIVSGDGQTGPVAKALAQPFTVKAADGAGKALANVTVTFAVTLGGGTLSATSVMTDAAGLAKTTLTLGSAAGANKVTASATGFTGSPLTFTATGTAVATLSYVKDVEPLLKANCTICHGPGGSQATRPLTTYAEVTTGKSTTYTPTDYVKSGVSASSLLFLKMNGSSGVGSVMPLSGKLGAADIQTIKDWIDQGAPLGAGAAVSLALVSGDKQTGPAGTMLPQKLLVVAKDAGGAPVQGQTVTFTVTAGGGSVSPASVVTDATGQAGTFLTLGATPATNKAQAKLGALAPVNFTATGNASTYSGEPLKSSTNALDQAALVALKTANVEPAPLASDSLFLRRVTADLTGRLPTENELTTFLADRSPSKRASVIDQLLASSDFSTHWSRDVLAPWACIDTTAASVALWNAAVKAHLDADHSLAVIVGNLATGTGDEGTIFDSANDGYQGTQRADRLMESFAGSSMQCGRCHDHKLTVAGKDDPLWKQDDTYSVYAFFAPNNTAATKLDISGKRFGTPLDPKWVGDGYGSAIDPGFTVAKTPLATRRQKFADIFTASNAFARGTAHRIFAEVVDPLLDPDQFLAANVSAVKQPALLQALADQFKAQKYSLKGFLRVILNSKLYQLSSNGTTTMNDGLLARRTVRRHHAEVIDGGTSQVAGLAYAMNSFVLQQFGYPARRSSIGERTDQVNLGQAFVQLNSATGTNGKITANGNAVTLLANRVTAGTMTLDDAIQTIFRTALAREATAAEMTTIKTQVAGQTPLVALQDVAVAVCATSEFVTR